LNNTIKLQREEGMSGAFAAFVGVVTNKYDYEFTTNIVI
jgi:hypothetical protein